MGRSPPPQEWINSQYFTSVLTHGLAFTQMNKAIIAIRPWQVYLAGAKLLGFLKYMYSSFEQFSQRKSAEVQSFVAGERQKFGWSLLQMLGALSGVSVSKEDSGCQLPGENIPYPFNLMGCYLRNSVSDTAWKDSVVHSHTLSLYQKTGSFSLRPFLH